MCGTPTSMRTRPSLHFSAGSRSRPTAACFSLPLVNTRLQTHPVQTQRKTMTYSTLSISTLGLVSTSLLLRISLGTRNLQSRSSALPFSTPYGHSRRRRRRSRSTPRARRISQPCRSQQCLPNRQPRMPQWILHLSQARHHPRLVQRLWHHPATQMSNPVRLQLHRLPDPCLRLRYHTESCMP